MVWSEGNMSLKNPMTPPGIDPGTIQLVAQRDNHFYTSSKRGNCRCFEGHIDTPLACKTDTFYAELSRKKKYVLWSRKYSMFCSMLEQVYVL